ncbi:unnamed protein product [Didymodactylos carnosus]|uniref:C2 domain-containing protein n=1 Tax=Didymodactylos carnosus TaxID=1234261 RepID=A0A814AF00_9BILA|nr:unnamed protein product [Didymodactylos carnosus]CAF0914182.1 unnamed protein product [Didymodactylos carnosus]CAF3530983.1 unnamed protein product [Didymodactylos carnosus]CAF3694668.1 unnamed protein product [Didymodactylos carnosus]
MSLKIVDPDFVKKTTPKKRTRQRFQEDVCVKTSLPPHVEGPVHSLLILHIPKLRWHSKQPPCGIAHVKVNWWGEENSSSIFRPQIVNAIPDHRQKPCTTAKYYIRSEMKQFSKYLTDAAELVLKILDSDTNRLLGIVKVQHLSTLNINNPIKGYLPIFTTKGEKLGDLFVTIRIILPGTNDSNDHLVWSSSDVSNPVSRRNSIGGNENNQGGLIDNGMRTFTLDRAYSADCLNSSSNATTIIQRSNLNHNTNRTETAPSRANTKVNLQKQQETLEHKNLPADTVVEALIERAKRLREDIVKSSLNKDKDVSTDTNVIDISSEKTRTNNALLTANSLAMLSSHDDNQRTAYDLLGIKTVAKTTHESTESILSDLDGLEYEQGLLDDLLYGTNVKTDSDLMSLSFNNEHQQHQLTRSSKTNMKIIHGRPPTGRQARSPNPNGARISRGLNSCSPSGSRSRSVARSTDSDSASKVSFDMPNSDVESSGNESLNGDGLSAERIRLLGHVRTARIKIDRLCLNALSTAARNGGRESPTHVSFGRTTNTAKKATTYFVEYQFPVIVNSRDGHINGATEVIKIASKRFESNNDIIFNHFSSYPVLLNSDTLKNWWRSLLIFKIYSRLPGINSPAQIGFCVLPLRDVLKAEYLHIEENLKVIDRTQLKINNKIPNKISKKFLIGNLKLMLELNSDSKDFKYELDRTRLQEKLNPNKKLLSICSPTKQKSLTKKSSKKKLTIINDDLILPKAFESKGFINNSESQEFDGTMTMNGQATVVQILVSIPEARNITQTVPTNGSSKNSPRNPYCVCRMFWNDGPLTSIVCWGTSTPRFNFEQRTPVLLSTSTLEKMYQNFLIIEVWDKKMSSPADKLIGIVKVSLQQFYTSFKDKRISHVLLRSQYPILGVDSWLPIIDPFTGILSGELKILLAVGSTEQVTTLQMQCGDNNIQTKIPNSNMAMSNVNNNTQYIGHSGPFDMIDLNSQSVEHQFEIMIEGINGLRAFESLIWGESDCFIQYHFPVQIDKQQSSNSKTISGLTDNRNRLAFQMRVNRTAATLCTSDPTFHDCGKFRYILSPSEALHKPFFAAYQSVPSFEASIPFEVWTRFYYPNIRDQLLAKGKLSASKLCSMTTMLINTDDKAIQSFRIPLEIVQDENHNEQHYISSSSASYGGDLLLDERQFKQAIVDRIGGSQVCLSVGIIRACGLKYAAKLQSRHDSRLSYPSQVGVNTYAKLSLSFLSDTESRVTRTVARSFVPEFNHSIDFPLPLIWSDKGNDSISLAEMLEHGELKIDLYHQITSNSNENPTSHSSVTSSAIIANPPPSTIITRTNGLVSRQKNEIQLSDVHLCYCTISLRELLAKNTGIKGWYPLSNPSRTANDQTSTTMSSIDSAENCVGGLELFVRFAQQDDRRRVIDFAKTVGWLADNYMDEEHFLDDQKDLGCLLTVSIDRIQFPIHLATRPGKDRIDERISVFVQYRLYDKMPIITKRKKPIIDKHYVSCELKFNKEHLFLCSSPFIWYLREEKFEIQIWTSENDHYEQAQSSTDKLIGSIYIDLNSLCDRKRKTHRLSAILPMFKNGTKDLAGSYVQTHITIDKSKDFNELRSYSASSSNDTEIDSYLENRHLHLILPDNNQLPMNRALHTITNNVFSVIINIEQAAHLPNVYSKTENEDVLPNPYVTYGTANSGHLYKTNVLNKTCKPMWNYQQQVKLSIEHLFNEKKNFILKVWHKINADIESIPEKSGDKVLGFVSIDLSPLLSGMQHISGWYNIIDMIGNVQGQLKITVIPQEDLLGLKRYKYTNYNYFNNRQKLDSSRSTATSATTTTGLNFMADLSARSGHICSSNSSTIQNNDDETNKQSLLMTNLRRQLGELDVITERLKARCYAGSDVSSETGRSSVPPPSEQNSMIGRQSDLNLQYRSHSATSKSQHQQLPSSCTKSTFDIDISEHFPESLNGKPLISNGLNVTDVLTLHNDQVRLAQQLMSKANHLLETSKDFFTTADMNVQLSNLNKNTNDNSNNQRTDHPMKASLKTNFNMTSEFQVPELDDEKLVILPITEHRQSPPLARQRLTTTTIKTSNIGIDERVNSFEHNYSPTTIISNGQLNHTSQTNNENENDLNNQAHWPIEILPDRIKTASSNIEQQAYSTITLPLTKRNKNNYNDGGGGNDDKHNDTVNIQPLNDLSAFNFDWNKMNVQRLNDITSFYRTDHIQTSVLVNDTSPLLNHQNFSITKEEIAILSPRATTITHTVVSTHDRIPKNNTLHRTSSSSSSPRLSSTVTVLPSQTNKEHEKIIPVRTIQRSTSPRSSSSVPPTSRTEEKSHQSLNPDTNCINANWIEEQKEQQDRLRKKQQQKQKSNEDQSKSTSRSPYLSFLDHPLPNFFPPNHKMKASMKQVSQALAVNHTNASDNRNELSSSSVMKTIQRIRTKSSTEILRGASPLETQQQQTKRLEKIFKTKYTTSS